eukprot:gene1858-19758_t
MFAGCLLPVLFMSSASASASAQLAGIGSELDIHLGNVITFCIGSFTAKRLGPVAQVAAITPAAFAFQGLLCMWMVPEFSWVSAHDTRGAFGFLSPRWWASPGWSVRALPSAMPFGAMLFVMTAGQLLLFVTSSTLGGSTASLSSPLCPVVSLLILLALGQSALTAAQLAAVVLIVAGSLVVELQKGKQHASTTHVGDDGWKVFWWRDAERDIAACKALCRRRRCAGFAVSGRRAYFRGPHKKNNMRGRSRDEIEAAFVEAGDDPVRFYLAPKWLDTRLDAQLGARAPLGLGHLKERLLEHDVTSYATFLKLSR